MARIGVAKERLLQVVSVTTEVTNSKRVSRSERRLRDRQEARRRDGGGATDAHPWRGDGAWARRTRW